ncbi:hypothetical protein l11_19830 [Neisseria weaveri LMG 5135]|nr:hypothetical protein l11_19830 [Neisseria weaveri LMG 5135]
MKFCYHSTLKLLYQTYNSVTKLAFNTISDIKNGSKQIFRPSEFQQVEISKPAFQ